MDCHKMNMTVSCAGLHHYMTTTPVKGGVWQPITAPEKGVARM